MSNDILQEQIDKNTVSYQSTDFPAEIYAQKLDEGDIVIPYYQRGFEWDEDKQSRFIESMMIHLPSPSVFLIENREGILEIVDGSQRIRTLRNFLQGNLRLGNLSILTELNGRTYNDIPTKAQRIIRNRPMKGYVFRGMEREAQLEMFRRINTQSSATLPEGIE